MEHGIDVCLASNGDAMCSWKKIDESDDILYPQGGSGLKKWINQYIMPYAKVNSWKGFDVVQMINPMLYRGIINYDLPERIIGNNGAFYLSSAGDDYVLWKAYKKGVFGYFTYDGDINVGRQYNGSSFINRVGINYQRRLLKRARKIIPCSYDYYRAYISFASLRKKTTHTIPLPINCAKIRYMDNIVKNKIVFFHGINRRLAKGTSYIEAALRWLEERYPNDVEVIINRRMPFADYVSAMQKANVVVDQCKTYSYGMNACIAMAQGKVVMSGNHPVSYEGLDNKPPIIWIMPDKEKIYNSLIKVLEKRSMITDMGMANRCFVEKVHNHRTIARQYLKEWGDN